MIISLIGISFLLLLFVIGVFIFIYCVCYIIIKNNIVLSILLGNVAYLIVTKIVLPFVQYDLKKLILLVTFWITSYFFVKKIKKVARKNTNTYNKENYYNKLYQQLDNYINQTSYHRVMLIDGDQGSGKTFFLKSWIASIDKKYTPLYLSLNGISKCAEINKKIVVALSDRYFFTDNIIAELSKNYLKINLNILKPTEVTLPYIIKQNPSIKPIVIFDDLERSNIDLLELTGYINDFLEHYLIKTIIIADMKKWNLNYNL